MSDELLRRAAERAASDDFFLASLLLLYAHEEGWDDAALAAWLGCPPADLSRLLLCRAPRPDSAGFRADVRRIAERFGISAERLAQQFRLAEAARSAREIGAAGGTGWLAAARDRPRLREDQSDFEPAPPEPEAGEADEDHS